MQKIFSIPATKMAADDATLKAKREELMKKLLESKKVTIAPDGNVTGTKTNSHYSTPTQFLIEVNKFQDYIERYFLHEEIFGEFGEKFPIESYMRIYDMIKLQQSKFKFRCAYTRDGLGGWLNILAVNQSKAISIYNNIKLIFSSDNEEPTKVDFKELWSRREERLSRLRMLLDSLSAASSSSKKICIDIHLRDTKNI